MARDILAELGLPLPPHIQEQQNAQRGQLDQNNEMVNSPEFQQQLMGEGQLTQPANNMFDESMQSQQGMQQPQNDISREEYDRQIAQLLEEHPILGRIAMNMNEMPQWEQDVIRGASKGADVFNKAFESTGIPKYAGAFGAGAAQEAGNMGISAANLLPGVDIEHLDLGKYIQDPDLGTDILFGGGRLTGGVVAGGAAGKAANLLGRPAGAMGLAVDTAKGAGIGYALGEDAEGEGRMTGAIVGGLLAPLSRSTNSGISQTVKEDAKVLRGKFNNLYEGVIEQADKEGLNAGLKVSSITGKEAKNTFSKIGAVMPDVTEAYNAAVKNPTLRTIHKAQSKLGEYIASQSGNIERGGHISEDALGLARKLEGKLEKHVTDILSKSKSGLLDSYNSIQKQYAAEAAPLLKNSLVAEHVAKYQPSSVDRFIKQIGGESKAADLFGQDLGGKYGSQLSINKMLNGLKKYALIGGTTYGAGNLLAKPIHNYISSMFEGASGHGEE